MTKVGGDIPNASGPTFSRVGEYWSLLCSGGGKSKILEDQKS